jgi:hypothetical protein
MSLTLAIRSHIRWVQPCVRCHLFSVPRNIPFYPPWQSAQANGNHHRSSNKQILHSPRNNAHFLRKSRPLLSGLGFPTLAILRPKITPLTKVRIPETLNLPWARECLILTDIFPHEVQHRGGSARELQEPFGGGLGISLIRLGQETWSVVWSGA